MDIKKLIGEMTLEEKAMLCSGLNFWETKPVERLDIPKIMMTDGPHGLRKVASGPSTGHRPSKEATCFPPAVLSACSFDRELLYELGAAIGQEALSENVRIVLGPGVNIKRSPLCGRNFEYFSEDPYLAGEMAASFIDGVQGKGVGTSIKHFAANNQETRRWSSDSVIDERTLREIYLPAFKKAITKAKPATVMCSYNRLNGEYASENRRLLTEILRDEWGFEGIVISDWGAVNDRVLGLKAGMDLEMPGAAVPSNDELIVRAVRAGELDEAVLNLAAERILTVISKYKGDKSRTGDEETRTFDVDAHDAIARKIASESMVLLKNEDNILPLSKTAKVAIIGEMAEKPRYQGSGSSAVNAFRVTSALEAARGCAAVTYSKGYDVKNCDEPSQQLMAEAVSAAKSADVCVVFVGLPHHYESEGYDRLHMRMPEGMNKLILAVASANPNVVVVLSNGAPVEMPWAGEVKGILEGYIGGQAGGGAACDILFGDVNPCGKLAETLPIKLSDNPSYLYYFGERDTTQYREGIFVGYRYYDKKEMEVLFPFGHGMSYTSFEYSNLRLSSAKIDDTQTLTVTANIKNTGNAAGKEIVQLYVGQKNIDDRLIRAEKELRGFAKISLAPGESKAVEFTLDKSAFSYYNTQIADFHVLSEDYIIMVGRSSRDIALCGEVYVKSTVKAPQRANPNTTVRDIRRMERGGEFLSYIAKKFPQHANINEEALADGSNYEHIRCVPEFVFRQTRLMGSMPGVTDADIQAWMDEILNEENV
ncbi:MAG: glycoside hydrolase family 3 C-terminal domain-containing protein [Oscillospiraceae bacterium]|nr:glycoside hydrolase family 3 C-terminal domain-containing protein [Oscillospiraceae bacterium]